MSRNNISNAGLAKRLPPSHPIEQFEEHRLFLIRSLERNDKEIAALIDLTRTLRSVKQEIIEKCGELTLLDLGSGKIRLSPNGDGLIMEEDEDKDDDANRAPSPPPMDAHARELCVDFLLRIKLRRKLLSRLFRRVNRVAHAMDGNEVGPPVPPKYGELRLHVEPSEVEAYNEHWKRQEAALQLIDQINEESLEAAMTKNGDANTKMADGETVSSRPQTATSLAAASVLKQDIDYGVLMSYKDGYEKVVNPETGDFKYSILDQPHEEDHLKIKTGSGVGAIQRGMTAKEKENEFNRWQAAILSRIPEQPTYADLGLEHQVFFHEERRKRAIEAAKDAPPKKRTFADDNDVRPEKGRGGKSLQKLQEEKDAKEKGKLSTGEVVDDELQVEKEAEPVQDPESVEEKADEPKETSSSEPTPESPKSKAEKNEQDKQPDDDKADDEEVVDNTEALIKRCNPISLCPIPSFYEQDMKRIRMVHGDLLTASMQSYIRQRLDEVIREYNRTLRVSQEAARRHQHADTKVKQLIFEVKREQAEYQMRKDAAQGEWMKRLQSFNNEKLNNSLKSRWNQQAQGTPYTGHYGNLPDPIRKEVARCGADLVDAVEMIAEGKLANPKFNEPFVPPPDNMTRLSEIDHSSGQPLAQQRQRIQQHYKKESDALAQQFRQAEEERQRCWRRMLKVKGELNIPQLVVSNHRPTQIPITDQNYHLIPLPNIAMAGFESVPREMDVSRSVLPTYIPAHNTRAPAPTVGDSESKYAIARVRARISADGSVAPVTLTKRGPDGLYARPAGRTRKGMDWDAVNGKWVPVAH